MQTAANNCTLHGYEVADDCSMEYCSSYGHTADAYNCASRCYIYSCTSGNCSFGYVTTTSCRLYYSSAYLMTNDGFRCDAGSTVSYCRANSCWELNTIEDVHSNSGNLEKPPSIPRIAAPPAASMLSNSFSARNAV